MSKTTELAKKLEKELIKKDEIIYTEAREDRHKESGEVFTPFSLCFEMINSLDYDFNQDHKKSTKTWIDPTCGTGNFLVALAAKGISPKNIFGVDLMPDNIEKAKERLKEMHLKHGYTPDEIDYHQNRNIVVADAFSYHFDFYEHDDLTEEW